MLYLPLQVLVFDNLLQYWGHWSRVSKLEFYHGANVHFSVFGSKLIPPPMEIIIHVAQMLLANASPSFGENGLQKPLQT